MSKLKLSEILPWTKKGTIPEICGEKNTVRDLVTILDHERSAQAQGKVRDPRLSATFALH